MEIDNNLKLEDLIDIISAEQKEKVEIKEEKAAGMSSNEVTYLQAKENLRRAKIKNDILEESLEKLKQDRGQRKDYASMIFNFMCWYLACVFFIGAFYKLSC